MSQTNITAVSQRRFRFTDMHFVFLANQFFKKLRKKLEKGVDKRFKREVL
jgi:hypothetical protein